MAATVTSVAATAVRTAGATAMRRHAPAAAGCLSPASWVCRHGAPPPLRALATSPAYPRSARTIRRGQITAVSRGRPDTLDYRIFFAAAGSMVSPWHDVSLRPGAAPSDSQLVHFVNEIPRGSRAKLEIATDAAHNPIKQDTKKGELRFYHSDSLVNYGAVPQTWEDPEHVDADTSLAGDDDPLDLCDLSTVTARPGEMYVVKVIGVLGMIDEGEMDWKLIGIRADDPAAAEVHDIASPSCPQWVRDKTEELRVWFRDYKLPDGKPQNAFAFDDKPQSAEYALSVIETTHASWQGLCARGESGAKESGLWVPSTVVRRGRKRAGP